MGRCRRQSCVLAVYHGSTQPGKARGPLVPAKDNMIKCKDCQLSPASQQWSLHAIRLPKSSASIIHTCHMLKKNPHRTEKINSTPGKPDPPLKFPTLTSPLQIFTSKIGYSKSQKCILPLKTSHTHTHTLSIYLSSVINSNFLFCLISKFLFKW